MTESAALLPRRNAKSAQVLEQDDNSSDDLAKTAPGQPVFLEQPLKRPALFAGVPGRMGDVSVVCREEILEICSFELFNGQGLDLSKVPRLKMYFVGPLR